MLLVGTVGPNTKDKGILREIIDEGINTLRFNFSHGDINEFNDILKNAREIKKDIHIMQDLSGSKIRVSKKLQYIYKLYNNEDVIFCGYDNYENSSNHKKIIPLNISIKELLRGNYKELTMKDGTIKFKIVSKSKDYLIAKVVKGGIVRAEKGCNIKNFDRSNKSLSIKDKEDMLWAIENKVEIICQSYVEKKEDIIEVKNYLNEINKHSDYNPKIWAKVESKLGVKNIMEITNEADGIVVGRGDLIPETSLITAPIYEDKIIICAVNNKKDIIIATHILDSMKDGTIPQLPEVVSIFNYINRGIKGFMLAGETSVGKAPIKTVKFIKKVVDYYEKV